MTGTVTPVQCPSCGASREYDHASRTMRCRHCGSEEAAVSPLAAFEFAERSDLVCPTCGEALSRATVVGVALHACTQCLGSLIAIRQFVAVIEAVRLAEGPALDALPPRTQEPGDRTVSCPSCRQPMLSHLYGGGGNLVLDTCETCQLNWLDGGELRRIALSPRRSG